MKRWLKWIIAALLVALLVLGVLRSLSARKAKQLELETQQTAAKAQAVVELTQADWVPVKTMEMQLVLAVSGPLKAVNSAFIKARVAGELQGLTVREGDAVTAGQIIARIDSTEFVARVRQAQQQAESAKAQVDIAKRSFENNRSLVEQGFISKTALESSMATLAAAQASHQAAQAGADVATKSLDDTVLRAPITGVVSQRLAQPGERVGVDTRIVEIVDLSQGTLIPFSQVSAQGVQTTFQEAKLQLIVKPHVTADGSVAMHVKINRDEPDFNQTSCG